jgi:hypothetical protein
MKKIFATILFTLTMLALGAAQQPGSGQSPSSPVPGANQQSMPGSADQTPGQSGAQPGAQAPMANVPVTQGCLGGSDPNYTITDTAGTTYKLNIPPSADTSKLAPHVGEPVQVAGNLKGKAIDVQGIGRGTNKCPASGSTGAQSPPKQ